MLDLRSVYFGQQHKDFTADDFDLIKKISRLAKKHQRQCENACNGQGYVNGVLYTCASIDEQNCQYKSAYLNDEWTVFDKAISDIETKIQYLAISGGVKNDRYNFTVEFQHDPRGATVKLYYEGQYIEL